MNQRTADRPAHGTNRHPRLALAALAFVAVLSAGVPAKADPDDGGNLDEFITGMTLGMLGGVAYAGVTAGSIVADGFNIANMAKGTYDWALEIPGYALGGIGIVGGALMMAYQPDDCDAECRDFFVIGGGVALGLGIATLITTIVTTSMRLGDEREPDDIALPLGVGFMADAEATGISFAIPW